MGEDTKQHEWRLFPEGTTPTVSTAEFHAHRARAPHLEQPEHHARLVRAADFVLEGVALAMETYSWSGATVSDLGCGDGGLLSLLKDKPTIAYAWGYDFAPANREGWAERDVEAFLRNVFELPPQGRPEDVRFGDIVVLTEVLEHLADPHQILEWIGNDPATEYVVASSPWHEDDTHHDECHAWAWDTVGFPLMFTKLGYTVLRHEIVGGAQLILAKVGSVGAE